MIKFVDCPVRLPNLKTLEILDIGCETSIQKYSDEKSAKILSIRQLCIPPMCHRFIGHCPNLEDQALTRNPDSHPRVAFSHGRRLKRIAGVTHYSRLGLQGEFSDTLTC